MDTPSINYPNYVIFVQRLFEAITVRGDSNANTVYDYQITGNLLKNWCKWRQRSESLEVTGVISYYSEDVLEI